MGGIVDDVDFEKSEGIFIFEVDVDFLDDKEVIVKINVYIGKVVNIVYED